MRLCLVLQRTKMRVNVFIFQLLKNFITDIVEDEYHFIPKADEVFYEGDSIVAIGKIDRLGDILS